MSDRHKEKARKVYDDVMHHGMTVGLERIATALADTEAALAIRIEKILCEKLGRVWTPDGISVVSLIDELASKAEREGMRRAAEIADECGVKSRGANHMSAGINIARCIRSEAGIEAGNPPPKLGVAVDHCQRRVGDRQKHDYFFDGANKRGLLDICEDEAGNVDTRFADECAEDRDV